MNPARKCSDRRAGAALCFALAGALAGHFGLLAPGAIADTYPSRPVRLIVPFPAGGGVDVIARLVALKLAEGLSQPVVIDNRSSGGGILGAELAAHSIPDGYTLLVGNNSTHGVGESVNPHLPYRTIADFTPISLVGAAPHLLLMSNSVPAKTVREFIDLAKSRPGKLNYGSSGSGSQTQMSMELFNWVAGTRIVEIPYKGVAPAFAALMGGEIQVQFAGTPASLPLVKSGDIRALAITGEKRSALLPDMQTLHEQGIRGFETGPWYGILGPAKMPAAVVNRLLSGIGEDRGSRGRSGKVPVPGRRDGRRHPGAVRRHHPERTGEVVRAGETPPSRSPIERPAAPKRRRPGNGITPACPSAAPRTAPSPKARCRSSRPRPRSWRSIPWCW